MKALLVFAGILLLVGGGYFLYDGYEQRKSTVAVVEKEFSSALKSLTDGSVKPETKINNESAAKMIGGGVAVLTGILLVGASFRNTGGKKSKKRRH